MSDTKQKKKIYLVIAGDKRQYETWKYFYKGLSDYGSSRFISDINQLRGYTPKGAEIVLYGEYWKNKAFNDTGFEIVTSNFFIIKPDSFK